ncbi:structural protein [Synechococcus phage S-H9-1]|uniref:Structural protein n=1 Tax=Synechococcus phage S-H9-1 TaxID=2783674 RepID=A0A873WFK7_9CAUD|nr:structural protein [Synechococcus phage S-H9-1]QPB08156.1 structural protein [Synechococcus phage S-H9-1]
MADRFPLIVNAVSKKIEELVAGDNLELTSNGIIIGGDTGSGKYLTSDGTQVLWGSPGDVFLNQSQTLTNKTLESCALSGTLNSITNLPNSSLINSGITINGSTVALGGSITTPDNNTTYTISAQDSISASQKIIRITGSDTSTDDVVITAGTNMNIARSGDEIILSSTYIDTNTVTRLQAYSGGALQDGDITIRGAGSTIVTQDTQTKTLFITSTDDDTITRLRATAGQVYNSGDFTFLAGGATSVVQGVDGNGDPTITYSSTNTVTRLKGGGSGTFTSGDVTITGGTNVTVSQAGSTVTVASVDTNDVTKIAANSESLAFGDFRLLASGATNISTSVNNGVKEITISSVNTDTGAAATASGGVQKSGNDFRLKNNANFTGNTVLKWDSGNSQLANSIILDDGSTITIGGDLVVEGTQTTLNTTTLVVEDNIIELRKGPSITASDGGIQVNLTTDSNENVVTYRQLQWYNAGGYWRSFDGSVSNRFVTENETQVLTNKTLTSPTLTAPILGAATASSINGLQIATTASATLDIASAKTLDVNRDLVLTSDNNSASITVNFRNGGNVAYTSDTLATFASTTSTQLRGLITDTTGLDRLVFQTNPTILTGITTTSPGFTLLNSGATAITAFGAAASIDMGAAGGTFTINQNLVVNEDLTVGSGIADTITINGILNSENADILIRGSATDPMRVGRGIGEVSTNTALGVRAINSVSSGSQNTAIGFESLFTTNTGAANTAIGNRALRANGIGSNNIAIGRDALLVNLSGDKNIAIGNNAMESMSTGSANVCIGHYAGYGITGTGNVLIGPADDENSTNATYVPPNIGGSRQLVIGSGTEAWIRGDANFNLTLPNNLTVDGDATISGNLVVNGDVTSINSNVIQVDDKEIELASVVATTFSAVTVDNTSTITSITINTADAGLIPGMEVNSTTGGISVPAGTTIVSISGNTATLSAAVTGSGTAIFTSPGATDLTADQGGIRVRGTTDKRIFYDHSRTDKYWVMTENLELNFGKKLVIGNQLMLNSTTLGSTIVNSSLTSVGTLTGLDVDGAITLGGVITEKTFNNFSTTLTPSANVLTLNLSAANTILGTPATTAINEWAFTNAGLSNGQSKTVTLILSSNTAATYGDACSVDGNAVTNGVQWSGGSPPIATSNTDILTFVIVRDNAGVVQVFGQGNTDFS